MNTTYTTIAAALLTLTFSACEKKENNAPEAKTHVGHAAVTSIFTTTAPENAISISEAKKSITPDQEITIKGKVLGSDAPFVGGRAMMLIGDPEKLISCDLKPEDKCKTPWDVCCNTPEERLAFTATVQIVDKKGKLIKHGLKGIKNLKELSHVIVNGKIAKGSDKANLIINATSIYVQP